MDSIAFRQQQRRHFEPPSRSWDVTKRAILEAKGARECADVAAEQAAFVRFTECAFYESADALFTALGSPPDDGRSTVTIFSPAESETLVDQLWNDLQR